MRSALVVLLTIAPPPFTAPLAAQWLNYPDVHTPRTKDGRPNLTAPAPRINGRVDFSGVWQAERPPESDLVLVRGQEYVEQEIDHNDLTPEARNVFWGVKVEEQPLRPEGVAILKQRTGQPPPVTRCLPAGVPAGAFIYSFKMIQTPREIVVLAELNQPARQIYIDGRALPIDPQPSWMGYSIGKWDRDALDVETTGFTEASWLDLSGHPRSENTRVRERYRRRDFGHMDLEVTVEDPKYYTRPFSFKAVFNLLPDTDVLEYICGENEKDRVHVPGQ
jgi:hypothetical protein